jgi:hypothetical protein
MDAQQYRVEILALLVFAIGAVFFIIMNAFNGSLIMLALV